MERIRGLVPEASKRQLSEGGDRAFFTAYGLARVLDIMLRLLHPFTPFVTEARWGYLKQACLDSGLPVNSRTGWEEALILARWPERMEMEGWEDEIIKDFNTIQEFIRAIRNLRSEYKIEPSRKLHAVFVSIELQISGLNPKSCIVRFGRADMELTEIRTDKPESQEGMAGLVINEVKFSRSWRMPRMTRLRKNGCARNWRSCRARSRVWKAAGKPLFGEGRRRSCRRNAKKLTYKAGAQRNCALGLVRKEKEMPNTGIFFDGFKL